jgi:hypothetical protein
VWNEPHFLHEYTIIVLMFGKYLIKNVNASDINESLTLYNQKRVNQNVHPKSYEGERHNDITYASNPRSEQGMIH